MGVTEIQIYTVSATPVCAIELSQHNYSGYTSLLKHRPTSFIYCPTSTCHKYVGRWQKGLFGEGSPVSLRI